jgi:adenylate cyclase
MAKEIERKFLVRNEDWRAGEPGLRFRQGYLSSDPERVVRVRIAGDTAMLTIKGITRGVSRLEFEYPIPTADADQLLDTLCEPPLIDKTRYLRQHGGMTWEIDEFHGGNQGLVVAEIELRSEEQRFEAPPWLGEEVSGDPRYFNSNLITHPYTAWSMQGDGDG